MPVSRDDAGKYATVLTAENPVESLDRACDEGFTVEEDGEDSGRECTRCGSESNDFDECGVCYWCVAADRDNGESSDDNEYEDPDED